MVDEYPHDLTAPQELDEWTDLLATNAVDAAIGLAADARAQDLDEQQDPRERLHSQVVAEVDDKMSALYWDQEYLIGYDILKYTTAPVSVDVESGTAAGDRDELVAIAAQKALSETVLLKAQDEFESRE